MSKIPLDAVNTDRRAYYCCPQCRRPRLRSARPLRRRRRTGPSLQNGSAPTFTSHMCVPRLAVVVVHECLCVYMSFTCARMFSSRLGSTTVVRRHLARPLITADAVPLLGSNFFSYIRFYRLTRASSSRARYNGLRIRFSDVVGNDPSVWFFFLFTGGVNLENKILTLRDEKNKRFASSLVGLSLTTRITLCVCVEKVSNMILTLHTAIIFIYV